MGTDQFTQTRQRRLGAFYTPRSTADFMADWILRRDGERLLEPSFGDGSFLRALGLTADRRGFTSIRISGVEIDQSPIRLALQARLIEPEAVRCQDFLEVAPFEVDAVIGNPPFVRLRHLSRTQRRVAIESASTSISGEMDPSGSLWMSFVLHAIRFIREGGRLAFVLPYDATYVRYAQPLWQALGRSFGSIRLLRVHERLFPELLQESVILLADRFGAFCNIIEFQAFETLGHLLRMRPVIQRQVVINELVRGERVFVRALLGDRLQDRLDNQIAGLTAPAKSFVSFRIGYVAGDKGFFHPSADVVRRYEIPPQSLRTSLSSTRVLRGAGIKTSSIDRSRLSTLLLPDTQSLTEGERNYLSFGVEARVADRYKCRVRSPWYLVPGTRIPDIILGVFSEQPILLINDARYLASNSLLCGYSHGPTMEDLATRWYTSLTLLQCELEVHALGGGVLVMVPREAGNLRLPKQARVAIPHLQRVSEALRTGRVVDAYRLGDSYLLRNQLGVAHGDLDLIREGIEVLAHWRTSARRSPQRTGLPPSLDR